MEQTELDLREIFYILRRRVWLILAMPLAAALTAGVVSMLLLQPVYSTQTTLWVIKDGSTQINYNDLLLNRNLTKTYAEVAKSRAVMTDVISRLDLKGVTVQELQAKLTVTPVRDTEILSFTVQDGDPAMAAKVADAVAEAFKRQIRSYMKVENVVVVDAAVVPTSPIRPRPVMNIAIALVLGGMAAVGMVFLLEYLDTSIKSPDDISRHLGLPVLGLIPVIETPEAEAASRRGKNSKNRSSNTKTVVQR